MSTVHVVPIGDLIEHETDEDEVCACGPLVGLVEGEDGTLHFRVIHHSLDDREKRERNAVQDPGPSSPRPSFPRCLVCPSCLRIRSPWHWLMRRLGACIDDQS